MEYFNFGHARKPNFGLLFFWPFPDPNLFLALFLSFSLGPFTLAAFCVSYSFWLSLKVGCQLRKRPGNGTLISQSSSGPFYDHFCTKTDNFDFEVATSECLQNPKTTNVQIDLF